MPIRRASTRPTTRASWRATCRSRSISWATSCKTPPWRRRRSSASAQSSCRKSARPTIRPTISSLTISRRWPIRSNPWAGRCWARRRVVGALGREAALAYMRDHYAAERMILAAAGRVEHAGARRSGARRVRRPGRGPTRRPRGRPLRGRGLSRAARSRAGPSRARFRWARLRRRGLLCPFRPVHPVRRRHVVAPVPGGAGEARPRL